MDHQIPIVSFSGMAPYDFIPRYPYGLNVKYDDPNPGVPFQEVVKQYYYVRPSYFFMHNGISKHSFCVISIVFGGYQPELEFAEKSLDSGDGVKF